MKFDQRTLLQIGLAVVALIVAAVFGLGGSKDVSAPAPTAAINEGRAPVVESASPNVAGPVAAAAKSAPVAVPNSDGDFDYYVLVLSWSPTHCSSDAGRGRDDDMQCRSGRPFGFVLHGLWPQYERGYPQSCRTDQPRVSDAVMDQALKLSPSADLVRHEWTKHGTCSGLAQADYFAAAALAVDAVKVPKTYVAPARPLVTTPDDVKRAFLAANSSIPKDGLSATCSRNELAEIWVCLNKDLAPRACSNDVRKKHCGARPVRMLAVRGDWPR